VTHATSDHWGVCPVLFQFREVSFPAYPFFLSLAVMTALFFIWNNIKRSQPVDERLFFVVIAALAGGVAGAKLPVWIMNWQEIVRSFPDVRLLLSGRTIVGGLIGGTLAVEWMKKRLGVRSRTGNVLAAPLALGIAIGRLGCFFQGCCFGKPTTLPWGVDFGDGILRHPTQLYESLFCLILFFVLTAFQKRVRTPGILFAVFMLFYFLFRFFEEFLRNGHPLYHGLTSFQWVSLAVVGYVLYFRFIRDGSYFKEHS